MEPQTRRPADEGEASSRNVVGATHAFLLDVNEQPEMTRISAQGADNEALRKSLTEVNERGQASRT